MKRVADILVAALVYGFFALVLICPLAAVTDELLGRRKMEVSPIILAMYALIAVVYALAIRSSRRSKSACAALARRLGLEFSCSRGFIPGMMYWPSFKGTLEGRTVRVWFRGRRTTAVAVGLSERFAGAPAQEIHPFAIQGREIVAIVGGVPGQVAANEAIEKVLKELGGLARRIDP